MKFALLQVALLATPAPSKDSWSTPRDVGHNQLQAHNSIMFISSLASDMTLVRGHVYGQSMATASFTQSSQATDSPERSLEVQVSLDCFDGAYMGNSMRQSEVMDYCRGNEDGSGCVCTNGGLIRCGTHISPGKEEFCRSQCYCEIRRWLE